MKNDIMEEEVIKIRYKVFCPKCKKEIIGVSPNQVKYNLDVHIKQKHKDKI